MGKNIKQLTNRSTPALTDFLYTVAGDVDYNVTLEDIKDLFNVGDIEEWETETFTSGNNYVNLGSSLTYAAIQIEYVAKRGSRGYATGLITLLVDDSNTNGISVSDFKDAVRYDGDNMGLDLNSGQISAGQIQLKGIVDSSDANDVTFNYRIISKREITV